MDKTLLKAYIRTIVEEEVERIVPKMLAEAVREIKSLNENTTRKPPLDKARLSELLNLKYDGESLSATTDSIILPEDVPTATANPEIVAVINRDYSEVMKKLNLT
jgi:hypothetical protein